MEIRDASSAPDGCRRTSLILILDMASPHASDVSSATGAVDVGHAGALSDDRDIHGHNVGRVEVRNFPVDDRLSVGSKVSRQAAELPRHRVQPESTRPLLTAIGLSLAFGAVACKRAPATTTEMKP